MKVQSFWASSWDPVHGLYVSLQTAKMAKTLTSNQKLDEQTAERHYGYICYVHFMIWFMNLNWPQAVFC